MDDLLAEFVTETAESLAELDVVLLTLEQTPDDLEILARILRLLHTIKGTCGFLGLNRLEHIAHATEAVLGNLRDGGLNVSADTVAAVLRGFDALKSLLEAIKAGGREPAGDDSDLIAHLESAAAGRPHSAQPAHSADRRQTTRAAEAAPDTGAQTIRVNVALLEDLMTLVGELVLTRNQLVRIQSTDPRPGLAAPLQRLSNITAELQEGVMKTRMQPIGAAWSKLPRMVRDLSRDLGKHIELTLHGVETELDRQVLELIRDPITHMVRNSADHGLESPTERRAYGKPDTGRITLNAYHEGGHIIIEVGDDGAGLRVDRIRERALARGLASEAELKAMAEPELHRFIFHPGFSTATTITAVSGRGVGMDVVKTNVERIGGTIDLRSVPGAGTHFTIKIPLTLAIIPALIIAAGGVRFAIPQITVGELVRARVQRGAAAVEPVIERIEHTPMLRLRQHLLPLVHLAELLELAPAAGPGGAAHMDIVVVQVGAARFGLVVDEIFDAEEIVVKAVAPILRQVSLFSGNTILGDGSVIMILDTNAIARMVGIGASGDVEAAADPPAGPPQSSADRTSMLIFRAGAQRHMAVPLNLVARLENLDPRQIETSGDGLLTQYRGRLMKLMAVSAQTTQAEARRPVLVFSDHHRSVGLLVDQILDVVDERLHIEMTTERPGWLGIAVIAGVATDVIDTAYWLTRAHPDWFGPRVRNAAGRGHGRILIVDDSDFFRQLLLPALAAEGYRVTAVAGGADALRLRDSGERFDAILSDIEMPDMSGHELARQLRGGGPWAGLPLIALTACGGDDDGGFHDDREGYRHAGFNETVQKHDRPALLACLRRHLESVPFDVSRAA